MNVRKTVQILVLLIVPGLFYTLCSCTSSESARNASRSGSLSGQQDEIEARASNSYTVRTNKETNDKQVQSSYQTGTDTFTTNSRMHDREKLFFRVFLESRSTRLKSPVLYGTQEGLVSYSGTHSETPSGADSLQNTSNRTDPLYRYNGGAVSAPSASGREWSRSEVEKLFESDQKFHKRRKAEFTARDVREEDDIKVYTAAIIYYRDVVDRYFGTAMGQILQELAEEVSAAYDWSIDRESDFEEQMDRLSENGDITIENGPIESGTPLPGLQPVTVGSFLDKNIDVSPDVSIDTDEGHIDYGLGFGLLFFPGDSEIYLNGPEESIKLTIKMNY